MREKRVVTVPVELREQNGNRVLFGTPIVYNAPSELIYGYFQERILPGAFDDCLAKNPEILCLREHRTEWLLGCTSSKTLRIRQSKDGIDIECDMPNTTYALDLAENIRRKDLKGMSFGFDVESDEWYMQNKIRTRDVLKAYLHEVTFTVTPAYTQTEVGLRDRDSFIAEVERRLKLSNTPKLDMAKTKLKLWEMEQKNG